MVQQLINQNKRCNRPASLAFASKSEFSALAKKAFAKNDENSVARSVSWIAKVDPSGESVRFMLKFYSKTEYSTSFVDQIMGNSKWPLYNVEQLYNALQMMYLRKRLAPESRLWQSVQVNEDLYDEIAKAILPLFNKSTEGGKNLLARNETWGIISKLLKVERIRKALGTRSFGAYRFMHFLHKFLSKEGIFFEASIDDGKKTSLCIFKTPIFCDAPHQIFIEENSEPIFHNTKLKHDINGHFIPVYNAALVFNGKPNTYTENVPHEIEHSIQHLLGFSKALDGESKEYGAYLASLANMDQDGIERTLRSWSKDPGDKLLAAIFGRKDEIHDNAMGKILYEVQDELECGFERKRSKAITRKLLDDFYLKHLDITYTALEKTAEKLIPGEGTGQ